MFVDIFPPGCASFAPLGTSGVAAGFVEVFVVCGPGVFTGGAADGVVEVFVVCGSSVA